MDTTALKQEAEKKTEDAELVTIWRRKVDNIRKAWSEFEAKKTELASMPFKSIIELTQNCNFKCLMCPQAWEEKFKKYSPELNMSLETFVKIADQLSPYAIFMDLRGFGESTILPWWPEVVDYLERFPFVEWHLVTNLSLPRDDTWDKMMKIGFTLGFSCDGATKDTFESIRTRSKFDRILHNMGVIRDAVKRYHQGWIYFISTIQKKNVHELASLVALARAYDILEVQFKIVQDGGHQESIRDFDRVLMKKYVDDALDTALDLDIRVTFNDWIFTRDVDPDKVRRASADRRRPVPHAFPRYPYFDPEYWDAQGFQEIMNGVTDSVRVSAHQRCMKPFNFTYVNYKAEMGTCNHMMYPDMLVMGDLKTQSVFEVWNSAAYREFRRQLVMADPQDRRCQWCFKHRLED